MPFEMIRLRVFLPMWIILVPVSACCRWFVIADPVSTCVHEIFELTPAHLPRLVTKLYMPPRPSSSPAYQFCTVEYLISASSSATSSTTAACNWFLSNFGAVQPSRYETYAPSSATISVRSNCPDSELLMRK